MRYFPTISKRFTAIKGEKVATTHDNLPQRTLHTILTQSPPN
jgi:hypothetical protein